MKESDIERRLEAQGVLIDPGDTRTSEQIYNALFGVAMTEEAETYDPGSMSVEQKVNC